MSNVRITIDRIESLIAKESFYVFPETTTTVCCLTLKNGANVIGTSACVDKANFVAEIGERLAKANAVDKIWELEGYALLQVRNGDPEFYKSL